jgi:tight adherence protein C
MDPFTLVLLIATVFAFFGGFLVLVANIATALVNRAGVNRGLTAIDRIYAVGSTEEDDRAGSNPIGHRIAKLGRAATPGVMLSGIRRRLDYAGNPPYWTVDRMFEAKGIGLILVGVIGVLLGFAVNTFLGAILGGLLGAALGFYVPDLALYDISQRRQDRIRRTLPDIMDTLTVSVEAGLGFDAALAQVTRYGKGPLAGEFARVLQEMQLGRSRVEALRGLGERTNVTELRAFCAIVVQATELGVPIAAVLREQSREMRIRRRQRAEERALKVPVKILFPLIFCLFPAIFIVVLGPGVISIMNAFATSP